MSRRRRSSYSGSTSTSTTTTTSTSGGGGGMCGGVGNACYVYPNAPATPGLVTADVSFDRGIYMNGTLNLDDGNSVTIWGFTDLAGGGGGGMGGGGMPGGDMGNGNVFPSPAMRVTEGQIVHSNLTVSGNMWVHTIHHHGIEPHYASDGVGHISWDVDGTYTYQWRPHSAGTYFYHCHTNTVLHAEMGMYGAIIVDPPEGIGTLYHNGPTYDLEAFWVVDEIDPAWHTLCWDAGTCGQDVGLNDLNPKYTVITGFDGASSALTATGVAATVQRGQKLLVRYVCAGYYPQRVRFGGLTGTVYMSDGRPLPNPYQATEIRAHSAERYDIIFAPTQTGTYTITFDVMHWVTGQVVTSGKTRITVV
jgi:FtsP/CotA-like multicopper oxidase with cupredoxin domain